MIISSLGNIYLRLFGQNNRIERIWKLAQTDFRKRYYNDKLGIVWALLNPILQVSVYYFVFKTVMNTREENFGFFLFAGLLVWTTLMIGTKQGLNIFKMKKYLIENIQFNKLDLFFSHIISVFMGFCFILILIILFTMIFGVCLILSTFTIGFKDIIHIWDFMLLCGFWTAGIFFPVQQILERFGFFLYANPMLGLIHNARQILMYKTTINWHFMLVNGIQAVVVLCIGLFVFYNFSGKAIEKL